ncbi:GNAT family N-acetyltransferase [Microbacteriaceae bacterium VKM Ac-2855]|nr:GNAT family N-acetyltransferase [Microbacteriaceae bacterium VKM Ac-2855]
MTEIVIRPGGPADVAGARAIERSADERFPPGTLPSVEVTDPSAFAGALFLIAERDGRTVGFALAFEIGDATHLEQLSVSAHAGRAGVGTALLAAVVDDASARDCTAVTLTTFRSFPWNAPFYQRRGFIEPRTLPSHLVEMLADEARMGFDPDDRVGLLLPLGRAQRPRRSSPA